MLWMQLTANEHEYDWENLLVVRVGGNIAEADRDEAGEAKVEASAVPALVAVDIYGIQLTYMAYSGHIWLIVQ